MSDTVLPLRKPVSVVDKPEIINININYLINRADAVPLSDEVTDSIQS